MNKLKRLRMIVAFVCFPLLTGCWSSMELRDVAMVIGVGIDKAEKDYKFTYEILRTANVDISNHAGDTKGPNSTSKLVLENIGKSPFDAARKMIHITKRRLFYTHTRIWFIRDKVAKDNIITPFDLPVRDQMFRLNSFVFLTTDDPKKLLTIPTLFESLTSLELATSLESAHFVSDFYPTELKDVFKMLSGPVKATILPVIEVRSEVQQPTIQVTGTAVIKNTKLVGILNSKESMGMLWLRNRVEGGAITIPVNKGAIVIELGKGDTKVTSALEGDQLKGLVDIHLKGTVANVPPNTEVNESFMMEVNKLVAQAVKKNVQLTLHKLQKEYRTDISSIGLKLYRKSPKDWKKIEENFDEVFSNADIQVHVSADINHEGLVNQTKGEGYLANRKTTLTS